MHTPPRITREDGDDLGFVLDCLFAGAIGMEEFTAWVCHVIEHHDDLPGFMFDLVEFGEEDRLKLSHWETFGGFVPYWDASEAQKTALDGIGFARVADFDSDTSGRAAAPAALKAHPEVAARFRATFPFIALPG